MKENTDTHSMKEPKRKRRKLIKWKLREKTSAIYELFEMGIDSPWTQIFEYIPIRKLFKIVSTCRFFHDNIKDRAINRKLSMFELHQIKRLKRYEKGNDDVFSPIVTRILFKNPNFFFVRCFVVSLNGRQKKWKLVPWERNTPIYSLKNLLPDIDDSYDGGDYYDYEIHYLKQFSQMDQMQIFKSHENKQNLPEDIRKTVEYKEEDYTERVKLDQSKTMHYYFQYEYFQIVGEVRLICRRVKSFLTQNDILYEFQNFKTLYDLFHPTINLPCFFAHQCMFGNKEMIEFLIDNGADCQIRFTRINNRFKHDAVSNSFTLRENIADNFLNEWNGYIHESVWKYLKNCGRENSLSFEELTQKVFSPKINFSLVQENFISALSHVDIIDDSKFFLFLLDITSKMKDVGEDFNMRIKMILKLLFKKGFSLKSEENYGDFVIYIQSKPSFTEAWLKLVFDLLVYIEKNLKKRLNFSLGGVFLKGFLKYIMIRSLTPTKFRVNLQDIKNDYFFKYFIRFQKNFGLNSFPEIVNENFLEFFIEDYVDVIVLLKDIGFTSFLGVVTHFISNFSYVENEVKRLRTLVENINDFKTEDHHFDTLFSGLYHIIVVENNDDCFYIWKELFELLYEKRRNMLNMTWKIYDFVKEITKHSKENLFFFSEQRLLIMKLVITFLQEKGGDINRDDDQDNTPLHLLCKDKGLIKNTKSFFEWFLKKGGRLSLNRTNQKNDTPYFLVFKGYYDTPNMNNELTKKFKDLTLMFIKSGTKIEKIVVDDDGNNLLHLFCSINFTDVFRFFDIFKFLTGLGINPKQVNSNHENPFHIFMKRICSFSISLNEKHLALLKRMANEFGFKIDDEKTISLIKNSNVKNKKILTQFLVNVLTEKK